MPGSASTSGFGIGSARARAQLVANRSGASLRRGAGPRLPGRPGQGRARPRAFAHHVRGRHLRDRGEYGGSVADFEPALHHSPQDTAAAPQHAASLKDAGRSQEAIEAYKKLLAAQDGKPNTAAVNAAINLVRLRSVQNHGPYWATTKKAKALDELVCALSCRRAGRRGVASAAIEHAVELGGGQQSGQGASARARAGGRARAALQSARRRSDPAAVARLEGLRWSTNPTGGPTVHRSAALARRGPRPAPVTPPRPRHVGYANRTGPAPAAQRNAGSSP